MKKFYLLLFCVENFGNSRKLTRHLEICLKKGFPRKLDCLCDSPANYAKICFREKSSVLRSKPGSNKNIIIIFIFIWEDRKSTFLTVFRPSIEENLLKNRQNIPHKANPRTDQRVQLKIFLKKQFFLNKI